VAKLFCQLRLAPSLREITARWAACQGKLRHLGIERPPKRSTLAYANQHRPWQLWQTVFARFYSRCQAEAAQRGGRKLRFRHKLLSLDATMIPLCLSLFDWALYRRSKGAVKLHLVLDHDGYLPQFAVVTPDQTADIAVARRQRFEPGTMLVFDRGYTDLDGWLDLSRQEVSFVTRLKDNIRYGVVQRRPVGRPSHKPLFQYKSFLYQAESWKKARRVVAKVEFHVGELFPRVGFIVTNLETDSRAVVRFYNKRGTAEQWIKEGKQAVKMRRLSCHRFRSNEVRLWLSVIANNLGNLWRRLALPLRVGKWSLTSLQQRLVKTGGRLVKHARYYWLLLAEGHLTRRLFGAMVRWIEALTLSAG
jgi:hypothetical protein